VIEAGKIHAIRDGPTLLVPRPFSYTKGSAGLIPDLLRRPWADRMGTNESRPAMDDATDVLMMRRALALAAEARSLGEVPVGAVVSSSGRIVAEAHNLRETLNDPTAHAERLALTRAGQVLRSWRLDGCVLYVTLEPCPMCAGAISLSRISRLVYGAPDWKAGACRSLYRLVDDPRSNHRATLTTGLLAEECGDILSQFFLNRRQDDGDPPRRGA
jgi:tRNA(adenine34) deaminase